MGTYLETLNKVEGMETNMFVPVYAETSDDIKELFDVYKVFDGAIIISGNFYRTWSRNIKGC